MFSKIVTILLVLVLTTSSALIVYENRKPYTTFDYASRYQELEKSFKSSQYVNKNPDGWVPDEVVYAYAGGALIKGTNPILVLPEVSTLGKYTIGLSTILFNNENIINLLVMGVIAIIGMVVLGIQIFKNLQIALIPPILLSFEPLFRNQFKYVPHMDIMHMAFLLWSCIFFNYALEKKRKLLWLLLSVIMIGLFISTKFYISGIPIVVAISLVLLFNKHWKLLFQFILLLPLSIVILLLTYIRVFAFGYTLFPFLGIQRWIFEYHTGKVDKTLSVWPLIYLNQWYVWWGDKPILQESQWRFTWPLTTTLSLLAPILQMLKKIPRNSQIEVLYTYTIAYLAFLSIGQTTARYLVILQPILYIISVYLLLHFVKYIKNIIPKPSV